MKLRYFLLSTAFLSLPAWADVNLEPLLNKITLQLQTEEWVTTKSALAYVTVNAAVTDQGLEKIQENVMQKLGQIASGEWHIASLIREQDKSGLENVAILAQIRLAQTELGSLRTKAKAISKPGETYEVKNVQFTPSEEEIEAANTKMRNAIYLQAKAEIDAINKQYPDQKYYLHKINFMSMPVMPQPIAMEAQAAPAMNFSSLRMTSSAPLSVGNKASLRAEVELAAMPDVVSQKLAKP